MAGQPCMEMPINTSFCDHAEQMIPPVKALGSSYVGVMYRPRAVSETTTFWRVVGVVDGTQLTYSTAVGGPAGDFVAVRELKLSQHRRHVRLDRFDGKR